MSKQVKELTYANFPNSIESFRKALSSFSGENDKKYKAIACAIRNDGSGWGVIENEIHGGMNVLSVVADSSKITVNFDFTATKIVSFIAVPDETFAKAGYFLGASVGTQLANINVYENQPNMGVIGGYVRYNGSAWQVTSITGNITVNSFSSGVLELSHDAIVEPLAYLGSVTGRDGGYIPQFASLGDNVSQVKFFDYAGNIVTDADTNMKFFFQRLGTKTKMVENKALDPTSIVNTSGNIWIIGVFEVA